jgi:hypothetical protein
MQLVVAKLVGAAVSAARAMVAAGMAMAIEAATIPVNWHAANMPGAKYALRTAGVTVGNRGELVGIRFVIMSYTPLHNAVQGTKWITYGLDVWGGLPREVDAT